MGRTVAQTAAGDMAVLDDHHRVLGIFGAQVVDDHFAVGAELAGNALGQLFTEFDFVGFHAVNPFQNFLMAPL